MLQQLISDCNRLIQAYNMGKREQYPHWNDFVLLPLAREIGNRLNMEYEVSGVYGLRFVSYISVSDAVNRYILTITPRFSEVGQKIIEDALILRGRNGMAEIQSLYYDTGEDKAPLDPNGFGRITKVLPDSVDEIIEIMKFTK